MGNQWTYLPMTNRAASPEVENFLGRLQGVRDNGSNWSARCPCRNDDSNPSLSIGQGNDGRVLVTCHRGSGCNVDEICEAMGVQKASLFPPRNDFADKPKKEKLTLVATYNYRDADGTLLFQKQRLVNERGQKTFRQRRPNKDTGEWIFNLGETPKVLYRLPEVLLAKQKGEIIWLVEGEKDADNLVALGLCATTPPNGAGKWQDIHTEALAGANVFIISDRDDVGREHVELVGSTLESAGCTVAKFIPPQGHKDISEMLEHGLGLDDLLEFNEPEQQEQTLTDTEELPVTDDASDEILRGMQAILTRDDISLEQKLNRASLLLNSTNRQEVGDKGRLVVWQDFLNEAESDSYDWVIPQLIEKGERVIVVAAEGVGKTMLARQIALCSAAGLHPFTMSKIAPIRTLTVDLENPERIIRRTSKQIMGAALHYGHVRKAEAHLLIKPAGLDLLKASDRAILEEAIEDAKPQLLIMGPLYKSFIDPGGRTSESIAIEVAKYLDTLRDVYGCAMWLEHHAPLGSSIGGRDLRPFGSAVWSRWPEFGLSLTPDPTSTEGYVYDVKHFRGARDLRQFPTKMKRGKIFPFEVLEFMKVD
jgi:hypothetical protein